MSDHIEYLLRASGYDRDEALMVRDLAAHAVHEAMNRLMAVIDNADARLKVPTALAAFAIMRGTCEELIDQAVRQMGEKYES